MDRAVARVLATKFRLGLFDNPYVDPDYAEKINNSPEHKKLAAEAARKVIVLLKNDKNLLPLDMTKLKSIAVIGPNAADVHLGGYSRDPGYGVSVLDGIKAKVGDKVKVLYAEGCKITTAPQGFRGLVGERCPASRSEDADSLDPGGGRRGEEGRRFDRRRRRKREHQSRSVV